MYEAYQGSLRRRNALDFDDFLLLHRATAGGDRRGALAALRQFYRYILVDEYQDVNHAQHRLLALLAAEHGNLCVVGDPLQNLFSWRGSDIRYLLEFQRDYPDARRSSRWSRTTAARRSS